MLCQICFDKSKKIVECKKCNENVCKVCFEKNIIHGNLNCMFCYEPHDINFMKDNMCFIMFKSLIKRKLYEDVESYTKTNQKRILQRANNNEKYLNEMNMLKDQNNELRQRLVHNAERCRFLKNKINFPDIVKDNGTNQLIYCCDVKCGNVLNESSYCDTCCTYSCSTCLCTYSNETTHLCKDKASITLVLATSKPCPNCKTYISKTDGCNQMWCVYCKTAFSWSTGLIMNSSKISFENPHRTEYLRTKEKGFYNRGIYYMDERPSLSSIRSAVYKYTKYLQLPIEYNTLMMNMKKNVVEIHHCLHKLTELIEYNSETDDTIYAFILKIYSDEYKRKLEN